MYDRGQFQTVNKVSPHLRRVFRSDFLILISLRLHSEGETFGSFFSFQWRWMTLHTIPW
jgi:hypothetical protein